MIIELITNTVRRVRLIAAVGGLLWSGLALGQDDTARSEPINRYEALQQQVRQLEEAMGRHDPALVENLISLADAAAALNLHSEASTVLDRAIQIQRLNLGLFTAEQIPLYFSMLNSLVHVGDWDAVNTALDYMHWLLIDKQVSSDAEIVEQMIRLSEFHLLSVAGDAVQQQANHYRQASELLYFALNVSEYVWGRYDPRRIDLHYSLAKQMYLQSAAVERGDETAYALRAVVPGSSWVRPRKVVQTRYYLAGLRLLEDMREVLRENENASAESVAMVDLYVADWHLLFSQERAEEAYRKAFMALLDAGREPAELNRLFASPQILPIATFHDTVDQALCVMAQSAPEGVELVGHEEVTTHLSFQEWFESMPVVPFPLLAPAVGQFLRVEHYDTWLSFRLDSLNKVSRWVSGTYETRISVADEFNVLGGELGGEDAEGVDLDYLDDRLHSLFFRPRLEDGVARPFEGILRFRAARTRGQE